MSGSGLDVCGVTGKVGENEGSLHCTKGEGGRGRERGEGRRERRRGGGGRGRESETKSKISKFYYGITTKGVALN